MWSERGAMIRRYWKGMIEDETRKPASFESE